MAYLDLNPLPRALQASLSRHFDNDESRRRAVLAPWALAGFSCIYPEGVWAWDPWRSLTRRKWAREVREGREQRFFANEQHRIEEDTVLVPSNPPPMTSIFDPAMAFFPTPLTEVKRPMRSPWPDVITDAEFWAYAVEFRSGWVRFATTDLQGYVPRLRATMQRRGWQRLRPWARASLWRDIVWRAKMAKSGTYL